MNKELQPREELWVSRNKNKTNLMCVREMEEEMTRSLEKSRQNIIQYHKAMKVKKDRESLLLDNTNTANK